MRKNQWSEFTDFENVIVDRAANFMFLTRSSIVCTAAIIVKRHDSPRRKQNAIVFKIAYHVAIGVIAIDEDE